jgi:hypothetical protein
MVDILLKSELFDGTEPTINLETVVVAKGHWHSQLKLHWKLMHFLHLVAHFHSIQESLEAVVVAMKHHLYTCEMIDDTILLCTKTIGNKV